jgi:hypothetical protein
MAKFTQAAPASRSASRGTNSNTGGGGGGKKRRRRSQQHLREQRAYGLAARKCAHRRRVPAILADAVDGCLEPEPVRRQTVDELAKCLTSLT